MISSLVIIVVLCGVAVSEEFKLVKVVTERKKDETPRSEYQEEAERYPLIVQQPYPIIVEKRIPYNEERYYRKSDPSVYTPTGNEFGYGPQVIRSPIIFAVSNPPAPRFPYPLRIQKENWPLPCLEEGPNCLDEKLDYPSKRPIKKKNKSKSFEDIKEENTKVIERDVPISSDQDNVEGSVQHRETFQTPILIAVEKPGFKYVKHLVGQGILPKARQFHVLILEEDLSSDIGKNELNNAEIEQKTEPENATAENKLSDNKQKEKTEENKEKRAITLEGNDTAEGKFIISPTQRESKAENKESPCEHEVLKNIEQDKADKTTTSRATIDIKKKQL